MVRGDGGKPPFIGKCDHETFFYRLGRVCVSHGWRVHPRHAPLAATLTDLLTIRACAALAKCHTAVGNEWIGKRLAMGHSADVSTSVNRMRKSPKGLKKYEKLLWKCKD